MDKTEMTYRVERMTRMEIDLAIDWAAREGWNPGLYDAECFYKTDPLGFFAGKLEGKIIAIGSAIIYDEHFAFCGFYIVDKNYRGKGYGLELTRKRLQYIGNRNAGIDGVTTMLTKYQRLGYQMAHSNARYQGNRIEPVRSLNPAIVDLSEVDFSQLRIYDRRHFPAYRDSFLQCWIKQAGTKSLAYLVDNKICGYGVIRACQQGYKIGPLFAENKSIAKELFLHLASQAQGAMVYLDIPESNLEAVALVHEHHMEKVFATSRMYLKGEPAIELAHVYGITSFELG